jgi:hypothetical protein
VTRIIPGKSRRTRDPGSAGWEKRMKTRCKIHSVTSSRLVSFGSDSTRYVRSVGKTKDELNIGHFIYGTRS